MFFIQVFGVTQKLQNILKNGTLVDVLFKFLQYVLIPVKGDKPICSPDLTFKWRSVLP